MVASITFQFGIFLLLQCIQFGHGFLGRPPEGVVEPTDPKFEAGGTLVLNCTLTKFYTGSRNASDIYFEHADKTFSYPYVEALSNITARLRLPNITVDMDGLFQCKIRDWNYLKLAAQSINVFRRPLQPVLDGCIVSNWEQMECSWGPSEAKQKNYTRGPKSFVQTLYYKNSGEDDNWKTCPQNASGKCTWPTSQFKMEATYCIQINATNVLNHTVASNVTCVLAQDDIVKPNCATHVESTFTSDGEVTLRWIPPASSYKYTEPLIYQLDVRNQWNDQMNYVTNATSMALSVVPATDYTLLISVRPSRLGFASEQVVHKFETPATVPCKNPQTQMNAFSRDKKDLRVLLYWQSIAQRDWCGPSHSYEVRAKQSVADDWRTVSSVGPLENSAEVMLNNEEDEVTIESKNSLGVATHLPHTILRIPSSSSGEYSSSSSYRLVVEGDDKTVMVHWFTTAPVENVKDYTLFWCKQRSVTRFCETPIQWKNLNGTVFEYNLTLSENYLHFQVGLAVYFHSGITSGIKWAEKLYSQTAKADAPHIVDVVSPYLASHGEIDLNWTPPTSCSACAYIHTYIIHYCLVNHQNMCLGEIQSVSIESWKNFTYSLVNLDHGSKYKIWMTSIARTGSSKPSEPIYETTTISWWTAGPITGIIIAILCVGTIAVGGLYIILRCLNKYRRKFTEGVPVTIPQHKRIPMLSTSSDAPMLGSKYEYNRQGSGSSSDSGRYSLSPASPATLPLLSKLPDANQNQDLDSFMPGNFNSLEDMKTEGDDDSTRGCVLSYTLVSNEAPSVYNGFVQSDITLPNGSVKKGDVTYPSVLPNGNVTDHPRYVFPEEIELLGMLPVHPESDVNYCTSFSFPSTGATSGHSAADIGYTKVENLQPLYDIVDRLPPATGEANEESQDYNALQFESNQEDEEPVERTIDQLLASLNLDPPLMNDLQTATSSEDCEPALLIPPQPPPRPGDNDAPSRGYMRITNTDFPSDDVEWNSGNPDLLQQSALPNFGYVDHAVFGVDSPA